MKRLETAIPKSNAGLESVSTTERLNVTGSGVFYGFGGNVNDYARVVIDGVDVIGNSTASSAVDLTSVLYMPFHSSLQVYDNANRSFIIYHLN